MPGIWQEILSAMFQLHPGNLQLHPDNLHLHPGNPLKADQVCRKLSECNWNIADKTSSQIHYCPRSD